MDGKYMPKTENCAYYVNSSVYRNVQLVCIAYAYSIVIVFLVPLIILKISFTLYPAHSKVGRENLVLRHSVPHFLPNSGGIAC